MAQIIAYLAGIDISKDRLDVYIRRRDATRLAVPNTPQGCDQLAEWLREQGVGRVAMEATGSYHRAAMRALEDAGFVVFLLQPKQVRAYAMLRLRRAKPDQLDAALIADCAAALDDRARAPADRRFDGLLEHLTYIDQLVADRVRLKTRSEHVTSTRLRRLLAQRIATLQRQIAAERQLLERALRMHADLGHKLDLVASIPGIGPVTALCLVVRMPELGTLGRAAAASLAGLAPFVHQSGRFKGETHIGGGRAPLRHALYMAALPAAFRHHGALMALYRRLVGRGKAPLCALLACARKLLVYADAVVARGTPWQSAPAAA
jgi:transposase